MRTDAELLGAYALGDESAFSALAERHGRMVYRTCLRVLRDGHQAEDAAQATFVVLVRKAKSLRRSGSLAAWLHRVARNVSLRALEVRANRAKREEAAAMAAASEARESDPERESHPALATLDRELDSLSHGQRQAVILRYLQGRSEREAAEIAGCPQGTLSRRASDGLASLRRRLERRGIALASGALLSLLEAEAAALAPDSLLPSLLATSKTAAAGAAGGAVGSTVLSLAEGVLRMMLWKKVQTIAAICAGAAALLVGGVSVAALPGEKPAAAEPRVAAVKVPSKPDNAAPVKPAPPAKAQLIVVELAVAGKMSAQPAFSPDGKSIALVLEDGRIVTAEMAELWKNPKKPTLKELGRFQDAARLGAPRLAYSPDGKRLAVWRWEHSRVGRGTAPMIYDLAGTAKPARHGEHGLPWSAAEKQPFGITRRGLVRNDAAGKKLVYSREQLRKKLGSDAWRFVHIHGASRETVWFEATSARPMGKGRLGAPPPSKNKLLVFSAGKLHDLEVWEERRTRGSPQAWPDQNVLVSVSADAKHALFLYHNQRPRGKDDRPRISVLTADGKRTTKTFDPDPFSRAKWGVELVKYAETRMKLMSASHAAGEMDILVQDARTVTQKCKNFQEAMILNLLSGSGGGAMDPKTGTFIHHLQAARIWRLDAAAGKARPISPMITHGMKAPDGARVLTGRVWEYFRQPGSRTLVGLIHGTKIVRPGKAQMGNVALLLVKLPPPAK